MPKATFEQRAALSINHPEFLNEFAKPVNSVGRYVKSVVLLGRVVNYIQRLPRFEDLQHDKDGEGRTASEFMRSVKATPAFLQLDAALGRFRTATSGMLFDKGDHVDGHLASAYVVPHACVCIICSSINPNHRLTALANSKRFHIIARNLHRSIRSIFHFFNCEMSSFRQMYCQLNLSLVRELK
jgi:hypothetical protein